MSARWPAASLVAVALATAALTLAAHAQQATQTAPRPGDPARRPTATRSDAAENTAAIKGRVVGLDGRPLGQVQIEVKGSQARDPRHETTDADGRYEAGELPADAYTVTASKAGYATTEFGQRRVSYPGTRVRVADGETVERIDFILPRATAIAARVSDENGDPVQGAIVSLLRQEFVNGRRTLTDVGPRPETGGRGRIANDLGRLRLFGIQPGRYVIVATAAPAGPYRLPGYAPTYYPGSLSAGDAQLITVAAGAGDVPVELRIMPGRVAKVSGVALDSNQQPYTGRVLLAPSERSGGVGTTLQAGPRPDGTFEFINVSPGDYLLQTGFPGAYASQYVTVVDADVAGLTLRTTIGSTVRGRITLEGASSSLKTQDIKVYFVLTDLDLGPSPGTYRAKIDEEGNFEYVGLFGPMLLRPFAGSNWLVTSIRANGLDITDTPMPFGRQDQSLPDVEVVMTNRGAAVTGSVADARGQPVPACTVIVFATDRDRWRRASRFVKAARCEADGVFAVRGLPGAEYFAAAVDRLDGSEASGEWEDPAILESLAPYAVRLALSEGQTTPASLRLITR